MEKRTCKMCGVSFTRWENYSHAGAHTVRCHDCYLAYNRALNKKRRPAQEPRTCQQCGDDISSKPAQARFCSRLCRHRSKPPRPNGGHRATGTATCPECGDTFETVRGRNTYCGRVCSDKNSTPTPDQRIARLKRSSTPVPWACCVDCHSWFVVRGRTHCPREDCVATRNRVTARDYYHAVKANGGTPHQRIRAHRLRALNNGGSHEHYEHRDIFERDGWRCHLCGKKIDTSAPWPQPDSPSIDHLIPISLGGDDMPHNVAAAHLRCNQSKGNRSHGEQLRLIG